MRDYKRSKPKEKCIGIFGLHYNPHIVMYESLDVLPYQTLADIAVFLGIPPVSEESYNAFCLGNLKRQSNASSEEYLKRWQTEHLSEGFIELIS